MLDNVPQLALHVTAVFVALLTVAIKLCVPLGCKLTLGGATETETGAGAVTVTVACADLVPSAALVAVTVQLVAEDGAV